MKICVAGACGRMGRRILELARLTPDVEIGGAFDIPALAGTPLIIGVGERQPLSFAVSGDAVAEIGKSDVLIDFTSPQGCVGNAHVAARAKKPCVIGATGLTVAHKTELITLAREIPIVYAPNMSVGVNLLFKLTFEVAKILGLDYNIEISETHHNQKKDSPSGTAVRLAERAAEALDLDYPEDAVHGRNGMTGERPSRQIGMHALRGGDVVGDHTVSFFGPGERIELRHQAHSRDCFAKGALRAAQFVTAAVPGLYDMQDVLGLK
jgi:4-hydroxy-tetrahydrodipicolinate reductase